MDIAGMLDAGLTGGVLGGVLRLAPEVLKIFDRKNERAHELAMQDKAIEADKVRGAGKMQELGSQNEGTQLQALIEAVKGQAQLVGIKWVDAVNATVRPVVTYWLLSIYGAAKIAGIVAMLVDGHEVTTAIMAAWTPVDMGLLSGVLSFWFLNRTYVNSNR